MDAKKQLLKKKKNAKKKKAKKGHNDSLSSNESTSSSSSSSLRVRSESQRSKSKSGTKSQKEKADEPVVASAKKKTYAELQHMWTQPLAVHPSAAFRELDASDHFNLAVINKLNALKQKRIDDCDPEYENPDDYTDVLIDVSVDHLHEPDTLNQTMYVEFNVLMWWKEKALVGDGDQTGHAIRPSNYEILWDAGIGFVGDIDIEKMTNEEDSYWMEYLWSDYGIVQRTASYKGTIRFPLQLVQFPFDNQTFRLTVVSKMSLYVVFHSVYQCEQALTDMISPLKFYGWTVHPDRRQHEAGCRLFYRNQDENTYPNDDLEYKSAATQVTLVLFLEIDLRRNFGFYLYKIILLQCLINMFLFSFFALPIDDVANRLNGVVTLLLTSVAFSFAIGTEIPKVPYHTYLDYFFLINYFFIALVAIAFIILSRLRWQINPGYNASGPISSIQSDIESIYYGILVTEYEIANLATALGMCLFYIILIVLFCFFSYMKQNHWVTPAPLVRPEEPKEEEKPSEPSPEDIGDKDDKGDEKDGKLADDTDNVLVEMKT